MLFTQVGRIVAGVIVIVGAHWIVAAIIVMMSADPDHGTEILLLGKSPWQAGSFGLFVISCGAALGTLTDISRSLYKT